ncbi:MAG: helix-turn-helix domain-containing protein, partial [Thermomicrobiales bacterium]
SFHREGARWSTPDAIEAALAATTLGATVTDVADASAVEDRGDLPDTALLPYRIAQCADLTPRERDIFAELIHGRSNEAIAARLFISPRTVTTHVTRIYAKLGVTNRAEAIALVVNNGDHDGDHQG